MHRTLPRRPPVARCIRPAAAGVLAALLAAGCALKPPPPPPVPDERVRVEVNRPADIERQTCRVELGALREARDDALAARDAALQKARTVAGLAEAMAAAARESGERVYVIRFADGSTELRLAPPAREQLLAAARRAAAVVVRGYTDAAGDSAGAAELARRRASRVQAFLIAEGVPATSVSAGHQGAGAPIADNSTPEGRALNRRVEVEIRSAPLRRTLLDDGMKE